MNIYSLKADKTVHILRFGSPVIKYQTNTSASSSNLDPAPLKNLLFVLLQEGLLKIFNMHSMDLEYSIKTFQMQPMRT